MAESRVPARSVQEIIVVDSRTDCILGNADIYSSSIDDAYSRNAGKKVSADPDVRAYFAEVTETFSNVFAKHKAYKGKFLECGGFVDILPADKLIDKALCRHLANNGDLDPAVFSGFDAGTGSITIRVSPAKSGKGKGSAAGKPGAGNSTKSAKASDQVQSLLACALLLVSLGRSVRVPCVCLCASSSSALSTAGTDCPEKALAVNT